MNSSRAILLVFLATICQAQFTTKPQQFACNFLELKGALTCQLSNITVTPNTTDYDFHSNNEIISDEKITAVLFKNSNISTIPNKIFEKFKNLQDFHADSSHLQVLTDDSLKGAPNLIKLYLDHNDLSEVPENAFQNTAKLTRLRLGFNQITHLEDFVFRNLHNLVILALNDNLLQKVTLKTFQDLSNLQFLYLENNNIKVIQANSFQNNKGLGYLFLRSNECINLDFVKVDGAEDYETVYKKCEEKVVEGNMEILVEDSEGSGLNVLYITLICALVCLLVFATYFYWPFPSFL